eukprot:481059-Pyramimonas_sp.AAC.1
MRATCVGPPVTLRVLPSTLRVPLMMLRVPLLMLRVPLTLRRLAHSGHQGYSPRHALVPTTMLGDRRVLGRKRTRRIQLSCAVLDRTGPDGLDWTGLDWTGLDDCAVWASMHDKLFAASDDTASWRVTTLEDFLPNMIPEVRRQ